MHLQGVHFGRHARTVTSMPGGGIYRFPVDATKPQDAVMTAVDDSGRALVSYRISDPVPRGMRWFVGVSGLRGIEIVVGPDGLSTPGVALLVAMSSRLLQTYFARPHV